MLIDGRLSRRNLLITALLAGSGLVTGCAKKTIWAGTFLQPWKQHADMPETDWISMFSDIQRLGFQQIYIQWLGRTHSGDDWMLSEQTIQALLDIASRLNMTLILGLPHDDRWNDILGSDSLLKISQFFDQTVQEAEALTQRTNWARHPSFKGWYIPYEIEQYHWNYEQKVLLLADWLKTLTTVLRRQSDITPSISTYCSLLETQQTMTALWDTIMQFGAQAYPLIQDGAGIYGQPKKDELDQLQQYFQSKKIKFDLIIELFQEQTPISADPKDFTAISASPERVQQQLARFKESGARQAIAFSAYPWLTSESETAKILRSKWDKLKQ